MTVKLEKLSPSEWALISESAHMTCFKEERKKSMDRIDYALLTTRDGVPCSYVTVRELDSRSVYWQYGGAFPSAEKGIKAFNDYCSFVSWHCERYDRVTTLIENNNIAMLKMALHCGFRIIGIRYFNNSILLELLNDFTKAKGEDGSVNK